MADEGFIVDPCHLSKIAWRPAALFRSCRGCGEHRWLHDHEYLEFGVFFADRDVQMEHPVFPRLAMNSSKLHLHTAFQLVETRVVSVRARGHNSSRFSISPCGARSRL